MLGVVDADVKVLSSDNLELCVCVCVHAMQMHMFWTLHLCAGVYMLGEAGEGERMWEWDKYDFSIILYLFIF